MEVAKGTDVLVSSFTRNKTRSLIILFAIAISVMAYTYIVTPYPDRDLFGQVRRWLINNAYDFHSGQEGGLYFAIGKALDDATRGQPGIRINNRPSGGGVDNAIKVASSSSAFGLVQEDSISEGDFIRDEIKLVTPLYLEHVHIIYRKDKFEQYAKSRGLAVAAGGEASIIKVSAVAPVATSAVRAFFTDAVISSGSPRSGSSIVSSQILNTLDVAPRKDLQKGSSRALAQMIEEVKSKRGDGLDAVFWITGGPNGSITKALQEGVPDGGKESVIGLMGIDSTMAQLINARYTSKLRPSSFKGVYREVEDIPTIGVYSFLISSKDVPSFAVSGLLEVLEKEKPEVKSAMEHASGEFQLDQFDFREYFKRDHRGFLLDLIKNSFIFLMSVAVTSAGVMAFLVWMISGQRQVVYFRRLMHLYKDYTPDNAQLDEGSTPFLGPLIHSNQLPVVSKLVEGTKELLLWGRDVRADYDKGVITAAHYHRLTGDFDRLREIFQKSMSRRVCEVLHCRDIRDLIEENHVRRLYAAGYVRRQDYEYLLRVLEQTQIKGQEFEHLESEIPGASSGERQ